LINQAAKAGQEEEEKQNPADGWRHANIVRFQFRVCHIFSTDYTGTITANIDFWTIFIADFTLLLTFFDLMAGSFSCNETLRQWKKVNFAAPKKSMES